MQFYSFMNMKRNLQLIWVAESVQCFVFYTEIINILYQVVKKQACLFVLLISSINKICQQLLKGNLTMVYQNINYNNSMLLDQS